MSFPPQLVRHRSNPRYFADPSGRAVFLTGSHHWDCVQENGERPQGFDFTRFLDRVAGWGHSFVRLWAHEAWTFELRPTLHPRTGPGLAADGEPRFDLTRVNPDYLTRLRNRVVEAGERGLYVSVMLFNGWSLRDNGDGDPWPRHPFHRDNNVNAIDGDPGRRGDGVDVHTLRVPAITALQERYVEAVVGAVGDLPHLLFEISNESPRRSSRWQAHLVEHLRRALAAGGSSAPIGLTFPYPGGANRRLFASAADWVSPGPRGGWRDAPPPNRGSKVVLLDTDHLWGIGGDRRWIWKSFLRGHQPIYLDPLDDDPERETVRLAMGAVRRWSETLDLSAAFPEPGRASSGYCLASLAAGVEWMLVYVPEAGAVRLDLRDVGGEWSGEWIDPQSERRVPVTTVAAGRRVTLHSPLAADALLLLERPARTR